MVLRILALALNILHLRGVNLQREEVRNSGPLSEVELSVPNMVCEGCAAKVRIALESLPGVRGVKSNVRQKRVSVRYEPVNVQKEQLKEAVDKAGFSTVEVRMNGK